MDKMATNTKISDKPPIAPKSQALKLLAEEKRKMRPLQKRYVNSMKLRFEGISKSTGNVNYDITDKSRCWSEIDQSLTNLNLSIGSLVKRSASTSNDQLERQIQNSSFEDNSSPLPRCPSPLLVIKRCSEPPKDEVEENETNAVMKDSNSATHLDKARSLSQGDIHHVNKFANRRNRKSSDDFKLGGSQNICSKLFQSLGKGKKKREKKIDKIDIQIVSSEPQLNVRESSGSGTSEESSRAVSMISDISSNNRASFISQSSYNSISSSEDYDFPDTDNLDKTFQAAKEILTTEKTYNKSIKLLASFKHYIENYSVDEFSNQAIVPAEEFIKLFSNLQSLHDLSDVFCKTLQKRIEGWEESQKIADVIAQNGPFLKIYYQYTEEYTENSVRLEKLKDKYPKFKKAVADFESRPECGNLKISSFFLNPVQRLPRYKLLLENYLKRLEHSDIDHPNAVKALEVVTEAAAHVNDTMAQNQTFKELMELQSRISNIESLKENLIQPHRSLCFKGLVQKVNRKDLGVRFLAILSDILIVAKPEHDMGASSVKSNETPESMRIGHYLSLRQLEVKHHQHPDEFPLDFYVKSTKKSFHFRTETTNTKDTWMKELNEAIHKCKARERTFANAGFKSRQDVYDTLDENKNKLGHSAPIWIPDEQVTMCQICNKDFNLVHRRHHCRACGRIICGPCSRQKAPLQYKGFEVDRVCDTCFDTLYQEFGNKGSLATKFKKRENKTVISKKVPKVLKVAGDDPDAKMKGYLYFYIKTSSTDWKKHWFVLKHSVLYILRAPEDRIAVDSFVILGYSLEPEYILDKDNNSASGDLMPPTKSGTGRAFRLTHGNMPPLLFFADNDNTAEKWLEAFHEAISL